MTLLARNLESELADVRDTLYGVTAEGYENGYATAIETAAQICEGSYQEGCPDTWGWHKKDYAKAIRDILNDRRPNRD